MANNKVSLDEQREALNRADEVATHIGALLTQTFGDAGESFRNMSDEIQDAYLWAVHDRVMELMACLEKLPYPTSDKDE